MGLLPNGRPVELHSVNPLHAWGLEAGGIGTHTSGLSVLRFHFGGNPESGRSLPLHVSRLCQQKSFISLIRLGIGTSPPCYIIWIWGRARGLDHWEWAGIGEVVGQGSAALPSY